MKDAVGLARAIFLNARGEARCGWRVVLFFVAVLSVGLILTILRDGLVLFFPSVSIISATGEAYPNAGEIVLLAGDKLITFIAALVASVLCARLLERRSFGSVGFKLHEGWLRDFALGSAIGAGTLAAAVAILFAAGAVRLDFESKRAGLLVVGLVIAFLLMLMSAATEELLFRGFAFQALTHDLGPAIALGATSVVFGLLHMPNPSSTLFSSVNTVLAGIWLGLAYLVTRSLWLATALHCSWNFAQAVVFGLPVSGITTFYRLAWLKGTTGPPRWLSGLDYGPEGGAAATVTLVLSTVLIWKSGLFSASKEMQSALEHGAAGPRPGFLPPSQTKKGQE